MHVMHCREKEGVFHGFTLLPRASHIFQKERSEGGITAHEESFSIMSSHWVTPLFLNIFNPANNRSNAYMPCRSIAI